MVGTVAEIEDFLAQRRIALVGVSRKPKHFSRLLFRELRKRGYDVVPVNPQAREIDGVSAVAAVADVQPPPDGALLITKGDATARVLAECANAGIGRTWVWRVGQCPLMYLKESGFPHNVHRFLVRIFGAK